MTFDLSAIFVPGFTHHAQWVREKKRKRTPNWKKGMTEIDENEWTNGAEEQRKILYGIVKCHWFSADIDLKFLGRVNFAVVLCSDEIPYCQRNLWIHCKIAVWQMIHSCGIEFHTKPQIDCGSRESFMLLFIYLFICLLYVLPSNFQLNAVK